MQSIEFSPEKAWQAAVANLELDMSRAAFNTWVKPVRLVSFENDTFVIGCINTYGRDWLEGPSDHHLAAVSNAA